MIAGVAWLAAVPALTAQTTPVAPLRGDVDGDGRVTTADARIVADFLVGRPVPAGVSVAERGDVNGDGKVTSVDVAIVRAYAAGRDVSRFRVGAPLENGPEGLIKLQCVAQVRARTVECVTPGAQQAGGARADMIVGNQNVYVKVTSSNIVVAGNQFSFDVTLQNLLAQRMGTTDGTTPSADGIRIFFHDGPNTTSGDGEVTVTSGSVGMFTASNQEYHQYSGATLGPDGILSQNEVSAPVNWVLQLDPGVVTFGFQLYVNAPVQYQSGWVDVYADGEAHASSPYIIPISEVAAGATVQLTDTVRNAVGKTVPGAPVTWSSSDNAIATVDANTGLVTAVSDGTATITATSGARTGTATIIVSTASPVTSTITPAPASLPVGDTSVITVQLKNAASANITSSGGTVALSASAGTLTPVVDNNDGTYTAKLTHTVVGEVKVSGTLNSVAMTDTAEVTFTAGGVASFTVEAAAGGNIPDQLAGTPFNVKVTAKDAFGNTATGFTGTVDFSSDPAGASGTSAAFTAGVLSSHAITIAAAGTYTLTATRSGGSETGTSNSFQVQSPPTAVADAPLPTSAPGEPWHAAFNTALGASNVMTNDTRGFPLANVASFGGGDLGGTVTSNAAGSTVSPLPGHGSGSLSVAADGSVSFTPPTGFTGLYTFQYRISNVRGTSDAQVTIAVGVRPAVVNDLYPANMLGNVPINTATSTGFNVTTNDAGDAKVVALVGSTGGATVLNANGTFTFVPTAGFTGPNASFTYTVTNGFGTTAAATVTVPVSGIAWFVDADAAVNGDGRLSTPFKDLSSAFAAGTKPLANQPVFLYSSATSYTGGVTLLGGQRLVGEGATGATFAAVMNVTWPADAGTQPTINGTRPTVVSGLTLGNTNTLQGFILGGAGTLTGNNFGTLTVSEVAINTTGQALNLTTGTLAGAGFTQVRSTGGTNNVFLSGVTTSGTPALGTNADVLSGATGTGFFVTGGNGSFAYAGTITNTAASQLAVNVSAKTGGSVTFSGDINPSAAANGILVTGNNSGINTITFSGANKKISSGAAAGVNLTNNTGATISFTNGGLAITTSSGTGFNATGGGEVTVGTGAVPNTVASTAGGRVVNIQNTNIGSGNVTFRSVNGTGSGVGVKVENTGTAGGFKVTGDGSTASSGGILTLNGVTAADSAAFSLTSTANTSLEFVRVEVTTGNGATGIAATNLTGTNLVRNSAIDFNSVAPAAVPTHGSYAARFVQSSQSATITLDGVSFLDKLDGTTAGSLSAGGTATVNFNVIDSNTGDSFNSTFQGLFGSAWVIGSGETGGSTGTVNVTIRDSRFLNAAANGTNNLELGANASSTLNYKIKDNQFSGVTNASFTAGIINLQSFDTAVLGGTTAMDSITGNTIANSGTSSAVTDLGYIGIRVALQSSAATTHRVVIANNQITDLWRQGVLLSTRVAATGHIKLVNNTIGTLAAPVGQSGRRGLETDLQDNSVMNLEATGNTFTANSTLDTRAAMGLRVGTNSGSATLNATVLSNTMQSTAAGNNGRFSAESAATGTGTMCLDLRSNTLDGAGRLFTLTHSLGTFRVEGAGAGAVSSASISSANTVGTGNVTGTVNFNNGANCTQPPI
ncbi:MAG TPA: invasin domain 3-containing protein [Longimicrobium sp.]|nr:invasin domain 3-containing protein [Longimicrobium sp.]